MQQTFVHPRRSVVVLVAMLVFVAALLGGAPNALGAAPTVNSSAPLDWCPGSASICQDSKRITTLAPGTQVSLKCWVDSRTNGFKYPRWFYVTAKGKTGFVKAEYVRNQPSVPNCSTKPTVMASFYATGVSTYGKTQPTKTDRDNMKKHFGFTDWGKKVDWSGDCSAFSMLTWFYAGGRKAKFGDAYGIFKYYNGLPSSDPRKVKKTGTPDRGAFVFWNAYSGGKNFGHIEISLGNGWSVGTSGWDNQMLPVTAEPIKSAEYLGWALPF